MRTGLWLLNLKGGIFFSTSTRAERKKVLALCRSLNSSSATGGPKALSPIPTSLLRVNPLLPKAGQQKHWHPHTHFDFKFSSLLLMSLSSSALHLKSCKILSSISVLYCIASDILSFCTSFSLPLDFSFPVPQSFGWYPLILQASFPLKPPVNKISLLFPLIGKLFSFIAFIHNL